MVDLKRPLQRLKEWAERFPTSSEARREWVRRGLPWVGIVAVGGLTLGMGLGGASRLSYHEAIASEAAVEMMTGGDWVVPTLGGRPWLEKPPLAIWLIAVSGIVNGELTEAAARVPSALAAFVMSIAIGGFAGRRFGRGVGLLSALIQLTTVWTVARGRLAEADMILAAIVTATLIAFDRLRELANVEIENAEGESAGRRRLQWIRWGFFVGLGLSSMAKGVGFGASMILAVVAVVLVLDRDRKTWKALKFGPGWGLALALTVTWPLLILRVHPSAVSIWFQHISGRLSTTAEPTGFDTQTWPRYTAALLGYLLPWTPLAAVGVLRGVPRMARRWSAERFLGAWMVVPLALLSLATIRHAHYAIYALPPCSIWGALGFVRLGRRLLNRGQSPSAVRKLAFGGFFGLALAYGFGFAIVGPWLDRRGVEWTFYEAVRPLIGPSEPVVLLYNVPEWDRKPYETPFGPFPHDLAVRLYYLKRKADCAYGVDDLRRRADNDQPFTVIGRRNDLDVLRTLGAVETLAEGPKLRFDREYVLYRVDPEGRQELPPDDSAIASRRDSHSIPAR